MTPRKLSTWDKMKAYKLENNVYVVLLLAVSVAISIAFYVNPYIRQINYAPEIALAIATSLFATIFGVIADIYVKYKSHKNDQFLEGIQEFGIHNLHFNKQKLLQDLLVDCDKEVWISGYRLILTSRITESLVHAIHQGASIRMLISPPWHSGFKSVYGENERVMDYYYKVFQSIAKASSNVENCEVRFTSKPLFNDTYKIDMHLVTGPYLHNRDEEHHRITANDFFTYDLIKKSRLYQLIEAEYLTLWEEAEEKLDWKQFAFAFEEYRTKDLRESEKAVLIQNACCRNDNKMQLV